MSLSINLLKANMEITGEPAKACNFLVQITPPFSTSPIFGLATQFLGIAGAANLSFKAQASSLPGRRIATTPLSMYGAEQKMPYGVVYDELDVTFICSESMVERTFFDAWHAYIFNPASSYMHYYDDYVSTVTIIKTPTALDAAGALGAASASYTLIEAFPIAIQAQDLAWSSTDYLTLSVSFAYRRWENTVIEPIIGPFLAKPPGAGII